MKKLILFLTLGLIYGLIRVAMHEYGDSKEFNISIIVLLIMMNVSCIVIDRANTFPMGRAVTWCLLTGVVISFIALFVSTLIHGFLLESSSIPVPSPGVMDDYLNKLATFFPTGLSVFILNVIMSILFCGIGALIYHFIIQKLRTQFGFYAHSS